MGILKKGAPDTYKNTDAEQAEYEQLRKFYGKHVGKHYRHYHDQLHSIVRCLAIAKANKPEDIANRLTDYADYMHSIERAKGGAIQ